MKEKEFRELLQRAQSGNISAKEKELLEKLFVLKSQEARGNNVIPEISKQKVLINTLAAIRYIRRKQKFHMAFRYAALLLILISASYGIVKLSSVKHHVDTTLVYYEINTKNGERRTIILPDSSTIVLNSNSYCKYPKVFPEKQRKVILRGEAFFQVTRNEKKPFTVESADITTTVLGTSFNILENDESVTVTVSTGKVQVDNAVNKKRVVLIRDEQFSYNYSSNKTMLTEVNSESVSNWSRGILQFDDISFSEAISMIEAWYGVQIKCNSASIMQHTLKGSYENKSLDYVLSDLKFLLDINYTVIGDTILFSEPSFRVSPKL